MIETSIAAWAWMLTAMIASSACGLSIIRLIPWTGAARNAGIHLAFAFASAPLLLGLLSVLALGVFPGKPHGFHLAVVFTGQIALWAIGRIAGPVSASKTAINDQSGGLWIWAFLALLAVWTLVLITDTLFMPLTQNDSLEYATVGRLLFEARSLTAYPAMDPTSGNSGFYGPWTHPPLYPALIYFTNILQGHADAPGLMRLIAPWFALSTTGLVFTIGRLENRSTGVISALIFLSTPLFSLGAGSALLDSLPVQGMSLILCAIIAVKGDTVYRGLVIGLTLGAAMWSHSQAVLFLPLALIAIMINAGLQQPRLLALQTIWMLLSAGLVAAWPYFRNLEIFGAFISDNPAVFALQELRWSDYFALARSLESWTNKIQYGFFKGWFAPEAYSIAFWLMFIGIYFYLRTLLRQRLWRDLLRGSVHRVRQRWKMVMLGLIVCYLGGVLLSIFIGIDLMIKNERYMLILMPFVALFAGSGINRLLSYGTESAVVEGGVSKENRKYAIAVAVIIFGLFAAQLVVVGGHRWRSFDLSPNEIFLPTTVKRLKWSAYKAVAFLKTNTPRSETVFTLKPADMYYSERRMLSYLDPRLLTFYRTRETMKAYHQLLELGIRYVHVPDYSLPPMYNSQLQEILARPDLARLLFSTRGFQIYELFRSDARTCADITDLSPNSVPWRLTHQFIIGGRKGLYKLSLAKSRIDPHTGFSEKVPIPFFHRDISTSYICETAIGKKPGIESTGATGCDSREYRLDLDMEGYAYVQAHLMEFDSSGHPIEHYLIGETAVAKPYTTQRFKRRFVLHPDTTSIRISIEHRGDTNLLIRRAVIASISETE